MCHMYYMLCALERSVFFRRGPKESKAGGRKPDLAAEDHLFRMVGRLSDGIRTALCWPQVAAVIYIYDYIYIYIYHWDI